MKNINTISETFYNCCNIPLKTLDKSLKELYIQGYNSKLENIYPKEKIENFLSLNNSLNDKRILSVDNNIQYLIIEKFNLFFILGPINTNCKNLNDIVPFRPISCLDYIEGLLVNIIDDNLLFNLSCNSYNTYVKRSIEYVHNFYCEDITIDKVSDYLNINKSYFCNLFKKSTGITFSYFLNYFRVEKSKKLLENTNYSLLDIALEVGFNNQNYFTIVFKKYTNETPSQYRKNLIKIYA